MIDSNFILIIVVSVANIIAFWILHNVIQSLRQQIHQLKQFNHEQIMLNRHLVANMTKLLNKEQTIQIPFYGEFGEA